jgi:hypothetical protein
LLDPQAKGLGSMCGPTQPDRHWVAPTAATTREPRTEGPPDP